MINTIVRILKEEQMTDYLIQETYLCLLYTSYRCLQFPKNHWIRNTQYSSLTKTVFHNTRKQRIDRTADLIFKLFFNL